MWYYNSMKNIYSIFIILIAIGFAVGCSNPMSTDPISDGFTPNPELLNIDYSNPQLYTQNGAQTTLSTEALSIIENEYTLEKDRLNLGNEATELESAINFHRMLFENEGVDNNGDGKMDRYGDIEWLGSSPGENSTVSELLITDHAGGCTAAALVYASVLRHYGIPAVIVHTVGVDWARDQTSGHIGHVFVEFFADGDWYLFDVINNTMVGVINNGLSSEYDPHNLWIDKIGGFGGTDFDEFFVFAKGIDNFELGLTSNDYYYSLMDSFYNSYTPGMEDYIGYDIYFVAAYSF